VAFTTYIGKVVIDKDSVFYSSFMEDYNRDGKLFAEGLAKIIANVADGECSITTVNNGIFISGATNDQ